MEARRQVVVVGAGPAGLAVGAMLRAREIPVRILERASAVGSTWRSHYDRLQLHTHRRWSGLPGLPIPASAGPWVRRADFVDYLERYAAHHGLDVELGVSVERIGRAGAGFQLATSAGSLEAGAVVVATGFNHTPWLPAFEGTFAGTLLHSSHYRNAVPFAGQDVLVVGAGNSGADLLDERGLPTPRTLPARTGSPRDDSSFLATPTRSPATCGRSAAMRSRSPVVCD